MSDDLNWKSTQAYLKAKFQADREATRKQSIERLAAERRAKMFAPSVEAKRKKEALRAAELKRRLKRRPKGQPDPNARFKRGDLVQCSRLYLMRQRPSYNSNRKDENSKGVYYGWASSKGYVYVDWIEDAPFDRTHRQAVKEEYLEPLGTPR